MRGQVTAGRTRAGKHTGAGGSVPEFLEVTSIQAQIEVQGRLAVTHLDQVFTNRTGTEVEGVCDLVLPPQAFITGLAVWSDGRRIPAVVADQGAARQQYQAAAGNSAGAAPLERPTGAYYRLRLFPFPAHGSRRVEVDYTEVLDWQDGTVRYRLPLTGESGQAPVIRTLVLRVSLQQSQPFTVKVSPFFAAFTEVQREGELAAEALFADEELAATGDFELTLAFTGAERAPVVVSTAPAGDQDGYYAVWLPPLTGLSTSSAHRSVTLVLDRSTSMRGDRSASVREALAAVLAEFGPEDLFNLVVFANTATVFADRPVAASPENRQAALDFLDQQPALGACNYEAALQLALGQVFPAGLTNQILFLTDGSPTLGETDPEQLSRLAEGATGTPACLFAVGLGELVDRELLDHLAKGLRGAATYVEVELSGQWQQGQVSERYPLSLASAPPDSAAEGVAGQRVRSWPATELEPGDHLLVWDGRDEDGREVASGLFVVRLQGAGVTTCRRMVLVR